MKITVEHCDEKVTIQTATEDVTIQEFMGYIERIAYAVGYQHKNIKEWYKK